MFGHLLRRAAHPARQGFEQDRQAIGQGGELGAQGEPVALVEQDGADPVGPLGHPLRIGEALGGGLGEGVVAVAGEGVDGLIQHGLRDDLWLPIERPGFDRDCLACCMGWPPAASPTNVVRQCSEAAGQARRPGARTPTRGGVVGYGRGFR